MAGSSSKASPRFKKAVRKLTGIAGLTLAEAMKISDYTSEEVNDYALRQRIRRAASGGPVNKKPSQITTDASTPSSMSTMTTTPPLTKHKTKKVRHTSAAVQQLRKNKCVAKEVKKNATKYATQLYAEGQEKEKKLSAAAVMKIVQDIRIANPKLCRRGLFLYLYLGGRIQFQDMN